MRIIPKSLLAVLALYPLLLALPRLFPVVAPDVAPAILHWLPWGLFATAAVLGVCFAHSRVTFSAVLLGAAVLAVDLLYFERPAGRGDARVILLAGVMAPIGLAVFHRLAERGVFTRFGLVRLVLAALAGSLLILWPRVSPWPDPSLANPVSAWLRLPPWVVLTTVCCLPAFFVRKTNEGPLLGAFLALSLLYLLTAFNFRAVLWPGVQARAILLLFASGAALTLVVAVLDAAWRGATLDELTQLPARRALQQQLARLGSAYTIGVVDIDHFKLINDRHGHDVGDQVLRFVAARLREHFADHAFRLGGEEFVLLAPGLDHDAHVRAMEAARQAIGKTPFQLRGRRRPRRKPDQPMASAPKDTVRNIRVTASAGVAPVREGVEANLDVLKAADEALYRAKDSGRDRLCTAGTSRRAARGSS